LAYLVFGLGIGAGVAASAVLLPRTGVRPVATSGLLLVSLGLPWLSQTPADGTFWRDLTGGMLAVAIGGGTIFSSLQVAGTHNIAAKDEGLSSALPEVAPQLGGALGIALAVGLAGSRTDTQLAAGAGLAAAQTAGLELALLCASAIVLAAAVLCAATLSHIRPGHSKAIVINAERARSLAQWAVARGLLRTRVAGSALVLTTVGPHRRRPAVPHLRHP
jgi:hypothetical protein